MDNNNIAGVATTNSSDNNDNKTGIITNSNNTQAANMTPPTASTISIADLANIMKSQGLSQGAQAQILSSISGHGGFAQGSTVDMASVLAKIQTLEREKTDLSNQLSSTNSALTKYREEKSVGMKDKYIKEMKDFIDGLQLKDPEVKNLMHARMEDLAKQGNETGVWEILACASSNHRANVNQIENLTTELNNYRDKEKQLQGGLFQSEMNRIQTISDQSSSTITGMKRQRGDDNDNSSNNNIINGSGNIWDDFQDMVMKQGGNRGSDYGSN